MKLFGPTRTPWFGFAMMRFRELLIAFQVDDQIVIRARLPDSQPGEERDQKQHRDDRHVVRRGNAHRCKALTPAVRRTALHFQTSAWRAPCSCRRSPPRSPADRPATDIQ